MDGAGRSSPRLSTVPRVQGVEQPLAVHQLLELAGLHHAAVVQHQDAVVPAEERFVQGVGDHHPGEALQIRNGAGDAEGCLLIQGSGGLVHQKHGRVPQQTPGDGHTAGRAGRRKAPDPVLPQRGSPRPSPWMMGARPSSSPPGPARGGKSRNMVTLSRKVLLNTSTLCSTEGAPAAEKDSVLTVESSRPSKSDLPTVAAAARHEQIQQGGLPRAGSAHQGVAFPRLELGVLRGGMRLLPLCRRRRRPAPRTPSSSFLGDGRALLPDVLAEGVASRSIEGQSRPGGSASISGPSCRNMMESPLSWRNTEATPGVMPSPCRAKAAATRNTPNWGCHPRHAAQGAQHLGQAHPAALGLLGLGVALGEQPQDVLFGFEALHHGEAGKAVFDHGEEAVVFPVDTPAPGRPGVCPPPGRRPGAAGKAPGQSR